jgi:uncharacterized protein involved in outer membrane biogenesis
MHFFAPNEGKAIIFASAKASSSLLFEIRCSLGVSVLPKDLASCFGEPWP